MPLFQRYAIDHFIEARTSSGLISFAAAYAGVNRVSDGQRHLFYARLHAGGDGMGAISSARALCICRRSLFPNFNITPVGYILSRIMSDTNRIAGLMAWNLIDILMGAVLCAWRVCGVCWCLTPPLLCQ